MFVFCNQVGVKCVLDHVFCIQILAETKSVPDHVFCIQILAETKYIPDHVFCKFTGTTIGTAHEQVCIHVVSCMSANQA
jgi:hypothetical protein